MNSEILKAHAMVAQKKLSLEDFETMILGMVAGNRRVNPKRATKHTRKATKPQPARTEPQP
jgi:hypothetical protein